MTEWLRSATAALIPSLIVGVTTALITVWLSLRRFRSERWWERKADAYSRIVETLYQLKAYSDAKIPEELEGVQYSEEHKQALSREYAAAQRELSKATTIGAYIVCDEAAQVLDELRKRPQLDWNENPPWEIFEADSSSYGDALTRIRDIAKKDLGIG